MTKSTTAASKGNRFNKQNTNSALASLFLAYFFALLNYDVIVAIATFYVGRAHLAKNMGGRIINQGHPTRIYYKTTKDSIVQRILVLR